MEEGHDAAVAQRVRSALEAAGFPCWIVMSRVTITRPHLACWSARRELIE